MEWTFNGFEYVTKPLYDTLESPYKIKEELADFKRELGQGFSIEMLLKLYEIRAQAKLAAALYDLPEFFMDQLFKAFNSGQTIKISIDGNLEIESEE